MFKTSTLVSVFIVNVFAPGIVFAYVGPGAGISLLGALWGLLVGVVLAFGIILIWPLRMMLKKKKARAAQAEAAQAQAEESLHKENA